MTVTTDTSDSLVCFMYPFIVCLSVVGSLVTREDGCITWLRVANIVFSGELTQTDILIHTSISTHCSEIQCD